MLERFDIEIVESVLSDYILEVNPDYKAEKVEELKSDVQDFMDEHEMEWLGVVESKFDMDAPVDDGDFKEEYLAAINKTKTELTEEIDLIEGIIEFLESDVNVADSGISVVDVIIEIVEETPSDELIDVVLV